MTEEVVIRPFEARDQAAARALVLAGLGEHFGVVEAWRNPDLNDILASYADRGARFVVAERAGRVVGTGALVEEGPGVGRLVRMSVDRGERGRGLGRALVGHLVGEARGRGYGRVVVETNDDWADAIGLYLACGFREEGRGQGEVHLALQLGP